MTSVLGTLRSFYRAIVPLSFRQSRLVSRLKRSFYDPLLPHDTIYNAHYYANSVEPPAMSSAEAISESIILDLRPNTVVDVGCGTGALLEALQRKGCQVFGLEYSEAAFQYCRERGLDVRKFNLERDTLLDDRTFDVAISLEVAEHLPKKTARRYVDLLTRLSNVIVFTAAPPGQSGLGHINEQPPSYWTSKFQALGFTYDAELSERWRENWRDRVVVVWWFHQNLMVFRRI